MASPPSEVRTTLEQAIHAHRAGRFGQAEMGYRDVLRYQPNNPDALHGMALIGLAAGDPLGAIQFAERAASLAPKSGQPQLTLGRIYRTVGWVDDAVDSLRRAVGLLPTGDGEIHMLVGQTLLDARRNEDAVQAFNVASALRPTDPAAHGARALALHRLGRSAEAIESLRGPLKTLSNGTVPLALVLAFITAATSAGVEDEGLELVERACATDELPSPVLADQALKSAARIFEKRGEIDRAWQYIERGNTLRRTEWPFAQHEHNIGDKIESYLPERLNQVPKTRVSAEHPVFVVGMPRSGTTLVEQIIHAHPKGFGCGELSDIWWRTVQLQTMVGDRSFGPGFVDRLTPRILDTAANDHLRRLRKRAPSSAERIVDKMPANYLNLGLIWQMFPNARVIHCTRDPLDSCFSTYSTPFSSEFAYRHDMAALAHYYGQYRRLMDAWSHMFAGRLIEVNYESMVANQEAESRRIIDFLGLPWSDACLRYWEAKRVVRTASEEQVRQPIYTTSIGRAKPFEKYLGPLIEGLRPWMSA